MNLHFLPIVSQSIAITFLLTVLSIGLISMFFQVKKGCTMNRAAVKTVLFMGFWFFLALALLRPQIKIIDPSVPWLVFEEGLEKSEIDFWKDSLNLKNSTAISGFNHQSDQVVLVGKKFSEEELFSLRGIDLEWILPVENGLIRDLSWKGYLRKGEAQRIYFSIFSSKQNQTLKLGIPKTDSVSMNPGWNDGVLEFKPSGQGRSEIQLILEEDTIAHIRYFTGPSVPKRYDFQLGYPSLESRMLSKWLRENGEKVSEKIQVSRETFLQSEKMYDSTQILIIDPAQLGRKSIQDWVNGAMGNLLLIQVVDPSSVAQQINRVFGTEFELEPAKSSTEYGLSAVPFRWKMKRGQSLFLDQRIAIQKAGASLIGISLLESSYSLVLEGKNEQYEELWGAVLGKLEPDEPGSKHLDYPVFHNQNSSIQLFDQDGLPEFCIMGRDTVWLRRNPVNNFKAEGKWYPSETGWVDSDDFSVYVHHSGELAAVFSSRLVINIQNDSKKVGLDRHKSVSPWVVLLGLLFFLGGMWIEPKLMR